MANSNIFDGLVKIAESNGVNTTKKDKGEIYTEQAILDMAAKKGKLEKLQNSIGKERKRVISSIRKDIRDLVIKCFVLPLASAKDKTQFEKRYKDFSDLFGTIYIEKNPTFNVFGRISSDDYLPTLEKAKKQFEKYSK